MSDISLIGIKWICAWGTSKPTTAIPILSHLIAFSIFIATFLEKANSSYKISSGRSYI